MESVTLRTGALLFFFSAVGFAAVTSVELVDRSDVLDGASFGSAGPYERIIAKVHFAVDPKVQANRIIADIDLAPRNEEGKVEFSADLFVLKPRDSAKGNGTALFEISNRGGRGLLATFDFATKSDYGDQFLLQRGFTLVWVGWEFDVPPTDAPPAEELLRLYAPIATRDGQPITGLVRSEWTGDRRVSTIPLGDRNQIGYPVADPHAVENRMLVRDTVVGERREIPRDKWSFSDSRHVTMADGFEQGKIYEVIYRAKDPVVVGWGRRRFVTRFRSSSTARWRRCWAINTITSSARSGSGFPKVGAFCGRFCMTVSIRMRRIGGCLTVCGQR